MSIKKKKQRNAYKQMDVNPKKKRKNTFFHTQTTSEKLGDCCIISLEIFITRYPTKFATTVWTMPITWGEHMQ
jgi:hypothetical protein